MSEIKLETLTEVHIGSGQVLQPYTDFFLFQEEKDNFIGLVNDRLLLQTIGEKNLQNWLLSIEQKESTHKLVKRYAPNATEDEYTSRILAYYADGRITEGTTLKEQMHSGVGKPYIPGSSIKGAIRTAILTCLLEGKLDLETKIKSNNQNNRYSAKEIEKSIFGHEPQEDIFRALQISDCYFEKNTTLVLRAINLNQRKSKQIRDESKSQLLEVIAKGTTADLRLKLDNAIIRRMKKTIPSPLESLQTLFQTINNHTLSLLNQEIKFWQNINEDHFDDDIERYIIMMNKIRKKIEICIKTEGQECILRVGHASGWSFMTGGWAARLKCFEDIAFYLRRGKDVYREYPFPKSRRIIDDVSLLGFVKLTLN